MMTDFDELKANADDLHCFDSSSPPPTSLLPNPESESATRSFWLDTSDGPSTTATLGSDHEVDIAIVGSGITGVSAAFHLLDDANDLPSSIQSIAVFEAREFCSGATGRNGGHLTPASALAFSDLASNPDHLQQNIDLLSHIKNAGHAEVIRRILHLEQRTASQIIDLVKRNDPDHDKVELVNRLNWHLCFTPEEEEAFENSLQAASDAGIHEYVQPIRKVSKTECDETLGRPQGLQCAYEIPGSTVHPRKLVILLWTLAKLQAKKHARKLDLYTRTPIDRIDSAAAPSHHSHTRHRATLRTTTGHSIRARYVIHATNAYASHLLPQLATPSHGIIPTRAQCIAALPSSSTVWPMGFSLHAGYEYLHQRPHPHGEYVGAPFILGGGRYLSKTMEYGITDDGTIHRTISHFLRALLPRTFPRAFARGKEAANGGGLPDDADYRARPNETGQRRAHDDLAPVSHEWTGIIGMTRSKDPLVGPVPLPPSSVDTTHRDGQYIAAGYSGHGMTRAFSCSLLVASMVIAEERGELDRWQVPEWFPTCYLTRRP
ncbi:hypothetical protein V8E36_000900 [Tilletia maclaganii]